MLKTFLVVTLLAVAPSVSATNCVEGGLDNVAEFREYRTSNDVYYKATTRGDCDPGADGSLMQKYGNCSLSYGELLGPGFSCSAAIGGDKIIAEAYCGTPIREIVDDMCLYPEEECPVPSRKFKGGEEPESTFLSMLQACMVGMDADGIQLSGAEKEEYVNSGKDLECVQNLEDNIVCKEKNSLIEAFDECDARVEFIVAVTLLTNAGTPEIINQYVTAQNWAAFYAATADCENFLAPKAERCKMGFGDFLEEVCTVAVEEVPETEPEPSFIEEYLYVIIGGGVGLVVLVVGASFVLCKSKKNDTLLASSVGKHVSMGSFASYHTQQGPGAFVSNPTNSVYGGPSMSAMSNYSGSGAPGASPQRMMPVPSMASMGGASAMRPSNKYKGVVFNAHLGVWVAEIRANGVNEYLGQFDTEDEAARAYDIRAIQVHGDVNQLNFPFGAPSASAGGSFKGMPPPVPSRTPNSPGSSVTAGGQDTKALKEQLIAFYNFHDPDRPDIPGHVDKLFQKYNFTNIARAVKAKYKRLPPGWENQVDKSSSPANSGSRLGPPPGL